MTQNAARNNTKQDPTELVEHLTQTAVRLEEVLNAEASVLKARTPPTVIDFHEEKTRLTNEFALQMNAIKKVPHLIDRAPATRVAGLKAAMKTLHQAADQSEKLLKAAKSISDGVIRTVATVAARKQAPQTGYAKSGTMAQNTHRSIPLSYDARA